MTVSVTDYGAVGNGSTDDTSSFITALATSQNVLVPKGTYRLTAALTMSAAGQRLIGDSIGQSILQPEGSFDVVTISNGGQGSGIEEIKFNLINMTGGYGIIINNSTHVMISKVRLVRGVNGIRIIQGNTINLRNVTMEIFSGSHMIYLDGRTQRTDIVKLIDVTLAGQSTVTDGLEIDGNIQTVHIRGMIVISSRRGLWVRNSANQTIPQFIRIYDWESDLTVQDTHMVFDAGQDIHITDPYIHGSVTGRGISIANGVDMFTVKGGRITTHALQGVYFDGSRLLMTGVIIGSNGISKPGVYSGVEVGQHANGVMIDCCFIGVSATQAVTQLYGIYVNKFAKRFLFTANNLKYNINGGIGGIPSPRFSELRVVGYDDSIES